MSLSVFIFLQMEVGMRLSLSVMGDYRHPFDNQSLDVYTTPEGLRRTRLNTEMDGMSVFSFGITKAPQSFNLLMERFSLDRESLDYL